MLPSPSSPDPAPTGNVLSLCPDQRAPRLPHRWWEYPLGALALVAMTTIVLFFGASLPPALTDVLGAWWAWWPVIPAAAILAVPAVAGYRLKRWYWPICCVAVPGVPVLIYFALDLIIGALTGVTNPLGGGGYDIGLVMSFIGGVASAFGLAASIGTATGLVLADRPRR